MPTTRLTTTRDRSTRPPSPGFSTASGRRHPAPAASPPASKSRNGHHPVVLPALVDRRVRQPRRDHRVRLAGSARSARAGRRHRPSVRTSGGSRSRTPGIRPTSSAASPARRSAGGSRRPGCAWRRRSACPPPGSRPTGSRGRGPRGPSSPRGCGRPGRSSSPSRPRTPTSRRTGPRSSSGGKATSSSRSCSACSPARRTDRVTVSRWTPTSRAVLRVPIPSATWARTATTRSAGRRASKSGVPLRSENRSLQVEQRRTRVWRGPYRAGHGRVPVAALAAIGAGVVEATEPTQVVHDRSNHGCGKSRPGDVKRYHASATDSQVVRVVQPPATS